MDLNGPQVKLLHNALLSAFPTLDTLGFFVLTGLEETLEAIAGGSNLSSVVYHLIQWATAQGRLEELTEKAREANPQNPALEEFAGLIYASKAKYETRIQNYLRAFLTEIEGRLQG